MLRNLVIGTLTPAGGSAAHAAVMLNVELLALRNVLSFAKKSIKSVSPSLLLVVGKLTVRISLGYEDVNVIFFL